MCELFTLFFRDLFSKKKVNQKRPENKLQVCKS